MPTTISIPKDEYNYLKKCENIVKHIEEDESLNDKEIFLVDQAKASSRISKEAFLKKFKQLQNA